MYPHLSPHFFLEKKAARALVSEVVRTFLNCGFIRVLFPGGVIIAKQRDIFPYQGRIPGHERLAEY